MIFWLSQSSKEREKRISKYGIQFYMRFGTHNTTPPPLLPRRSPRIASYLLPQLQLPFSLSHFEQELIKKSESVFNYFNWYERAGEEGTRFESSLARSLLLLMLQYRLICVVFLLVVLVFFSRALTLNI